ncbi:MAG TPA: hypothetical protein VMP67_06490 [Candidatus Limnocylindria bacterium]|nr:hypothetical protein [Candidatus Limnocylindria bacterium]
MEQNEDTIRVLATGAAMNWTYTVAGEPFPARPSYEKNFGTAPADP